MAGSIFGTLLRVSTFGKSHGAALSAVIDGRPTGLSLSTEETQTYSNRRKPGQFAFTTPREEADTCEIFPGVFEGKTLDTPVAVLAWNRDQHSADYQATWDCCRPGHVGFGFDRKLGFRGPRGGGRSLGWETIGRTIGDAIAAKLLAELGIRAFTYVSVVGAIEAAIFDETICVGNLFGMPDLGAATQVVAHLKRVIQARDSLGGTVSCRVIGMFLGPGEPVFNKPDAELTEAVMSVGTVKNAEFGGGFGVSTRCGSEDNDAFCPGQGGTEKENDHTGDILDDVSNGSDTLFRVTVKATPLVGSPQETVNRNDEPVIIRIQGRCDPTIMPQMAVVVESMVNLVLADLLPRNSVSIVEKLEQVVGRA